MKLDLASLSLGGRPVLHDIQLSLDQGLVALCGPNGAGKTSVMRALAGLLPGGIPPDPRQIAYLPQGARSAWGLTVHEVAMLGRIPHKDRASAPVEAALRDCGVWELRATRIDRVSGGQARRAMLARVLATEPAVLLLDEPAADLDPAAQHAVLRLLRARADSGALVVVVLHALDLAALYADRVILLAAGRVVADGPPETTLPQAAQVFGLPWGSDATPRLLPPPTAG